MLSVATVSLLMFPIGVIGSLASLVLRFRRATGIERLQLRWLVTAAGTVAILYALALVFSLGSSWGADDTPGWLALLQQIAVASFGLIPIAIGISVLRYRLFDIDLVINRALLLGAMAVFISAVYVAIVVGVGALVGSQASPLLSATAAAVVALAFQPVRRRAQRLADRLVYGKRASPYEVLSQFSDRLGNAYASDELLPRMARAWPRVPALLERRSGFVSATGSSPRPCGPMALNVLPRSSCRRPARERFPRRRCSSRSAIRARCWVRCRSPSGKGRGSRTTSRRWFATLPPRPAW